MVWGSHNGGYEEFCLLGYNSLQSVGSQQTFRRNMMPPSSGSRSKKPKWKMPAVNRAGALKKEPIWSSENWLAFNRPRGVVSQKIWLFNLKHCLGDSVASNFQEFGNFLNCLFTYHMCDILLKTTDKWQPISKPLNTYRELHSNSCLLGSHAIETSRSKYLNPIHKIERLVRNF
jgi:hypothetical protein